MRYAHWTEKIPCWIFALHVYNRTAKGLECEVCGKVKKDKK